MSFKQFYLEETEESDIQDNSKEALGKSALEDLEKMDDEEIADLDVEGLTDKDEKELDKLTTESLELTEKSIFQKKPKEILSDRLKRKSKFFIMSKMMGKQKKEGEQPKKKINVRKINPRLIVLFNMIFEWRAKIGRFGRWMLRRNRVEYMKKHPIGKELVKLRKKKKRFRILKRRGDIRIKQKRAKRIAKQRLGGQGVDVLGRITRKPN